MKRIVMALLMAAMVISLTACGGNVEQNGNSSSDTLDREQSPAPAEESESTSAQPETGGTPEPSGNANLTDTDGTGAADIQDVPDEEGSKALVAYFSATGTTKVVAEIIAENMGQIYMRSCPRNLIQMKIWTGMMTAVAAPLK